MTLLEAVCQVYDLRVTCGKRHLVGAPDGMLTVLERRPYTRQATIICETNDEATAVADLLDEGAPQP
jgi:hypothetical protein